MAVEPGGAHAPRQESCRADVFIARKPVFDPLFKVQGYELSFHLDHAHPDDPAGFGTIDSLLTSGLLIEETEAIRGGRPAFIGVTRKQLMGDAVWMLPPARTVIQITESIDPDGEVLGVCRRLRLRGYRIALDHYRPDHVRDAFLPVADLAKVDVLESESHERARMARHLSRSGVTALANQVESMDVFHDTVALGYRFFQGSFFARPTTVPYWDIPGSKISCLRVLEEVLRPDLDFDALEKTIENELALSYKLLRYLESAYIGRQRCVRTLHDALVFLGEIQVRNWASVAALAGMASDKPQEVLSDALLRGRFCELLAGPAGIPARAPELFIAGMFTLLDAILDRPLAETLEGIPIAEDVKASLLGAPGPMRDVLDVIILYLSGDWDRLDAPAARLRLDRRELPRYFRSALAACVGIH